MFRHPKYYKELRKLRNKEEARAQLKVPSSNLDQAISKEPATAGNQRSPGPGLKQQAPSSKPQASAGAKPQAASSKPCGARVKPQAASVKLLD
jgi:hypothetical protein